MADPPPPQESRGHPAQTPLRTPLENLSANGSAYQPLRPPLQRPVGCPGVTSAAPVKRPRCSDAATGCDFDLSKLSLSDATQSISKNLAEEFSEQSSTTPCCGDATDTADSVPSGLSSSDEHSLDPLESSVLSELDEPTGGFDLKTPRTADNLWLRSSSCRRKRSPLPSPERSFKSAKRLCLR
eukprot:RCo022356